MKLDKFELFVVEKEKCFFNFLFVKFGNWDWLFKGDKIVLLNCVFSFLLVIELIRLVKFVKFLRLESYVGVLDKLFVFFYFGVKVLKEWFFCDKKNDIYLNLV